MTCIHSELNIRLANMMELCWSSFVQGRSFLELVFKVKFKLNVEPMPTNLSSGRTLKINFEGKQDTISIMLGKYCSSLRFDYIS